MSGVHEHVGGHMCENMHTQWTRDRWPVKMDSDSRKPTGVRISKQTSCGHQGSFCRPDQWDEICPSMISICGINIFLGVFYSCFSLYSNRFLWWEWYLKLNSLYSRLGSALWSMPERRIRKLWRLAAGIPGGNFPSQLAKGGHTLGGERVLTTSVGR